MHTFVVLIDEVKKRDIISVIDWYIFTVKLLPNLVQREIILKLD